MKDWDREVDLLIGGSGAGGLCAAVRAADLGLEPLVVEKSRWLGGVTSQSGGQLWLGNGPQSLAEDSVEAFATLVEAMALGFGDAAARRLFIERAPEALRWYMENAGLRVAAIAGLPDYYYPVVPGSKAQGRTYEPLPLPIGEVPCGDRLALTAASYLTGWDRLDMCAGEDLGPRVAERMEQGLLGGGAAFGGYMLKAAAARGIAMRTGARIVDLVRENGRIVGALVEQDGVEQDGEILRIGARRGIVLATGGYDWSPEMVRDNDLIHDIRPLSLPTVEGDSFVLAGLHGAAFGHSGAPERVFGVRQAHPPADGSEYGFVLSGFPHCMVVNSEGRRFCDESFAQDARQRLPEIDGSLLRQRNWPAWVIFDQTYVDRYGFAGIPRGGALPEKVASRAGSLRELAEMLGIDPAGLEAEPGGSTALPAPAWTRISTAGASITAACSAATTATRPTPTSARSRGRRSMARRSSAWAPALPPAASSSMAMPASSTCAVDRSTGFMPRATVWR